MRPTKQVTLGDTAAAAKADFISHGGHGGGYGQGLTLAHFISQHLYLNQSRFVECCL